VKVSAAKLLSVLTFFGVTACAPPGADLDEVAEGSGAEAEETRLALVETVALETTHFEERIELFGETEPIRTALVSAQVGGRITRLDLVEGEPVEGGTTVMRLNSAQGHASIDRLEVVVSQLENEIDRTHRLIERGLATEAQAEQLEAERDANREAIREVRAGIRETSHRAPISGIVTDTWYESGEFAGQGNAVARIIDIDTIVVAAGLPERDISYVSVGQTVDVRIEALDAMRQGTITRIGLEANERNRTFPLEIHIENADHSLRAGMRATVVLVKRQLPNALLIPRDAVVQAVLGAEVFVFEHGVAAARSVSLGPSQGRYVVIEEGLEVGDSLIVRGQRALVQGEPVEVTRDVPCCSQQFDEYVNGTGAQ